MLLSPSIQCKKFKAVFDPQVIISKKLPSALPTCIFRENFQLLNCVLGQTLQQGQKKSQTLNPLHVCCTQNILFNFRTNPYSSLICMHISHWGPLTQDADSLQSLLSVQETVHINGSRVYISDLQPR